MEERQNAKFYQVTAKTITIEGKEHTVYGLAQFQKLGNEIGKIAQIDDISPICSDVENLVSIISAFKDEVDENGNMVDSIDSYILEEIVEDYVQEMGMKI